MDNPPFIFYLFPSSRLQLNHDFVEQIMGPAANTDHTFDLQYFHSSYSRFDSDKMSRQVAWFLYLLE